jgi:hypothetical protein
MLTFFSKFFDMIAVWAEKYNTTKLERFLAYKNVKTPAEAEHWIREYDRKQKHFL